MSSSLECLEKLSFDLGQKKLKKSKECKKKHRNISEKKRRDQFNQVLNELEQLLYNSNLNTSFPNTQFINRRRDKCSILKDALQFLENASINSTQNCNHLLDLSSNISTSSLNSKINVKNIKCLDNSSLNSWQSKFLADSELLALLEDSLDSFYLIVNANESAELLYMSNTFENEILNLDCDHQNSSSVLDLLHEQDRDLFSAMITKFLKENEQQTGNVLYNFTKVMIIECRMQRNVVLFEHHCDHTSNEFEKIRICASLQTWKNKKGIFQFCLVCACKPWQPSLLKEVNMRSINRLSQFASSNQKNNFNSKHSMEWKFLWIEEHAFLYLGYPSFELLGNSPYDYYHWSDLDSITTAHRKLLNGWTITTPRYRFLTKSQQWIWMQSSCTLIESSKLNKSDLNFTNSKENLIFCENRVLDDAESEEKNQSLESCFDCTDNISTISQIEDDNELIKNDCTLTNDIAFAKQKSCEKAWISQSNSDSSSVSSFYSNQPQSSSENGTNESTDGGKNIWSRPSIRKNRNVRRSKSGAYSSTSDSKSSTTNQTTSSNASYSIPSCSSFSSSEDRTQSQRQTYRRDFIVECKEQLENKIDMAQHQLQNLSQQLNFFNSYLQK